LRFAKAFARVYTPRNSAEREVQRQGATVSVKDPDGNSVAFISQTDWREAQPNGLFYHAPDVPFFWCRGDGWVAAGMTEMLRSLPQNHPKRARIMQSYQKMMQALVTMQGKDGLWRQLLDHPEAWPETSCSAMFTFAMTTGVKNRWLKEKTFGPAARKGWLGLLNYLEPNGYAAFVVDLFGAGVCPGPPQLPREVVVPFLNDRIRFRRRLFGGRIAYGRNVIQIASPLLATVSEVVVFLSWPAPVRCSVE
jgi:hypothetical protein